ncbi:MAG: hypothetical protein AMS15_03740 [Planctomycetes bacterium DG_23]|nr:MAG: hypothetical protein AMS15_03740 [Planctomycetes bacterium DG_23]
MANRPVENAVVNEIEALYVYCIVPGPQEVDLGPLGLNESPVRTIPGPGISAVVHQCPARPYQSKEPAVVEKWVAAHHRVVQAAWKRFGCVLPMSFDTIVKGSDSVSAHENLISWMQEKQTTFTRQFERLAGKAEYGVQISWNPKVIAADLLESSAHLKEMERQIQAEPLGLAYVGRARLEKAIKVQMEAKAEEYFRSFYSRIRDCALNLRVERPRKIGDGTQMLLNVSCLLEKGGHRRLGQVLDQIAETPALMVRFTGPWPPYSFVRAG